MRTAMTAILALLLSCQGASSSFDFFYNDGNWTISAGQGQCVAINRPVIETVHAPFMYVSLKRGSDFDGTKIDVYFWPNALPKGHKADLKIKPPNGQAVSLPAQAKLDILVRTNRGLTRDELEVFRGHNFVVMEFHDKAISIETSRLGNVIGALISCADRMRASNKR